MDDEMPSAERSDEPMPDFHEPYLAAAHHTQLYHAPQHTFQPQLGHDYPHDPSIYCPSCDPFDGPPRFVTPAPVVYHPQQREQGVPAPHVLYRPFGEGDGHEQWRYGGQ